MPSSQLQQAVQWLNQGKLLAYPTEAVWGVGCDPWSYESVQDILTLKDRPEHKGLVLVAGSVEQVGPLVELLSEEHQQKLASSWPGFATWLLPDPIGWAPRWVKGEHESVAVRVTSHPLVAELCLAFGRPLVSTSANPAGQEPAKTASRVRQYFSDSDLMILPGELGGEERPSTIRELHSDKLIRA